MKYLKEFDSIGKLHKHYKNGKFVIPNVYITKDNQEVDIDMSSEDEMVCIYDVKDNGNPLWTSHNNNANLFESITIDGEKWNNNINAVPTTSNYYDSNKSSNIHVVKFKLKTKDFSEFGLSAPFFYNNHLEYVYLPEGFKKITDNMFTTCTSLKNVYIPDSLTSIGATAFASCTSLKEIHLNEGLLSIGQNAFNGCTSLEKINFPYTLQDGVGSNYHSSFNGCPLKYLYIDTTLLSTFYGPTTFPYSNLETLEFGPHAFTSEGRCQFNFGGYSFNNTNIKFDEGLVYVPGMGGCSGMNEIILPTTAKEFSGNFSGCSINLIDLSNTQISSLQYSSGTSYSYGNSQPTYSNPFPGSGLRKIILNNLITNIPTSCFGGCSNLTEINIPDSVMNISAGAFAGCSNLTTVHMSEIVRNRITNHDVFNGCYSVSDSYVENGIRYIDINDNVGTDFIRIEDKTLEEYTIKTNYLPGIYSSDIPNCKTLRFSGEFTEITSSRFNGYTQLETVILPSTLTSIGASAFQGCTNLETLEIPNTVTTIGANAFKGTKLSSITIPEGVTEISDETFMNCISLTDVTLPSTLTSIGASAFQGCSELETLTIPVSVTTIGENAFAGTKLGTVENGIKYFDTGSNILALSITDKTLTSYNIKNGTTRIEFASDTWSDVNNIESITLPNTLTYVPNDSFNDICNVLTDDQVDFILGINADAIKYGYILLRKPKSYFENEYLCVIPKEDNTTISFVCSGNYSTNNISYSIDKGTTWKNVSKQYPASWQPSASFICNKGDVVLFKNDSDPFIPTNSNSWNEGLGSLTITKDAYICGNIMSMEYGDNFKNQTTIEKQCMFANLFQNNTININIDKLVLPATILSSKCYYGMFYGCTSLTTVPELPVTTLADGCYYKMFEDCTSLTSIPSNYLPVTTLTNDCYRDMFSGCTSLTSAPALPATTLAANCYEYMFSECTSLVTTPELPATTLATYCYQYMFNRCTSLTSAPALPATTLADYCYQYMFNRCTSLTSAPALPATTLTQYCYSCMFSECTSLTIAPELAATTLANYCYKNMFYGCTSLTTAPELLATTLTNSCYYGMFSGCTSLNYVKCLATNISASNCTSSWLNNVASSGTIIVAENVNWTTIPSNWHIINEIISYNNFIGNLELSPEGYVTLTANDDSSIMLDKKSSSQTLYISNDTINWKELTVNKLYSFEKNKEYYICGNLINDNVNGDKANFYITGNVDISGNCNSIWNKDNLLEDLKVSCGLNMFKGCSGLKNAENLELPATTLATQCYTGMFRDCTSLVTTPELPATTLANYCYRYMFQDCTSLVTAPELPATTLSTYCYNSMFQGCTSLVTAPELPATTLATYCYNSMFQDCTLLVTAPELPATTLTNNCYLNMFNGCTSLVTAPELLATTLANNCYSGMFQNCTSLTTTPTLSATTLSSNCCEYMFQGCTSLTTISELPATTLANYCYQYMFKNCTSLTTVPSNLLPATTLTQYCYANMFYGCAALETTPTLLATTLNMHCYENMFEGCTSLTTVPELPANTLADSCYYGMFSGCTSLTTVPSNLLHATTLSEWCYSNMFYGCTSLTTTPTLSATTLTSGCYSGMFSGCTSLTTAPTLSTTTLATYCYQSMFSGCTSLTIAPSLPATTLTSSCYSSMFYQCTSLITAPDLRASTLVYSCYENMFYGCSKLNYIKCLATNISASYCVNNWLYGVSSSGTFVKNSSMSSWKTNSTSGIPKYWTVQNA